MRFVFEMPSLKAPRLEGWSDKNNTVAHVVTRPIAHVDTCSRGRGGAGERAQLFGLQC